MLGAAYALVGLGILELFSIGQEDTSFASRQIIWVILSSVVLFVVSSLDYQMFRHYSGAVLTIYGMGLALLFVVLLGGSSVRGAQSWIELGPVNIAPVEFVKITVIILLAKYFAQRHTEIYRLRHIFVSGMYIALPSALVLMQPEFGSFIILAGIWVSMMFAAGIPLRSILLVACIALVFVVFAWGFMLHDYQKVRLQTFLDPLGDPQGSGYQALQSGIAVGSAGLWGKGIGQGAQTQFGFLPDAHTDFIFAALSEELGMAGAGFLIVLFGILIWRILYLARHAENNFARFACIGFAVMISLQAFVNIGMNVGILPVTGIPIPFVSYGGSSMSSLFVALGFLQNIHMRT